MTETEREIDLEQKWAALKVALVRSLGKAGAAEWLAFAAKVMDAEAGRDIITLGPAGAIESWAR